MSAPWWKGTRGEWYVVAQAVLIALVLLGPRSVPGLSEWDPVVAWSGTVAGVALALAGSLLALSGVRGLGPVNLTVLPRPRDEGRLVETGAYSVVRHPIYSGVILMALGWGLLVHGWLTVGYALLLFAFFDIKSRREERWLVERFPEYVAYRKRVRKLVPWVY